MVPYWQAILYLENNQFWRVIRYLENGSILAGNIVSREGFRFGR